MQPVFIGGQGLQLIRADRVHFANCPFEIIWQVQPGCMGSLGPNAVRPLRNGASGDVCYFGDNGSRLHSPIRIAFEGSDVDRPYRVGTIDSRE